jgi:hypothetical protein
MCHPNLSQKIILRGKHEDGYKSRVIIRNIHGYTYEPIYVEERFML